MYPAGMVARRHGQEGHWPLKMLQCVFFVLQMFVKLSVDEVFMHYFMKMSSASGGGALPLTPLGDLSFKLPDCPNLENMRGAHACRPRLRGRENFACVAIELFHKTFAGVQLD